MSEARPVREHDANTAGKTGVEAEIALLDIGVEEPERLLVLADLGYEKLRAFPAVVVPEKVPKDGKLSEDQRERNRLILTQRT
ncbi:hypothetical protein [Glycomyces arizonensis]|uniref:hypothetical protein n=1 Tax=Glycomyces arizonensis TaxID=256035 RepID=UPI000417AF3F|nr:hypothetical protein [Glycomyces arizonensis]